MAASKVTQRLKSKRLVYVFSTAAINGYLSAGPLLMFCPICVLSRPGVERRKLAMELASAWGLA